MGTGSFSKAGLGDNPTGSGEVMAGGTESPSRPMNTAAAFIADKAANAVSSSSDKSDL